MRYFEGVIRRRKDARGGRRERRREGAWLALSLVVATGCGRVGFGVEPSASLADAPVSPGTDGPLDALPASKRTIALDGGASWTGWDFVASSLTAGYWVEGTTDRTFSIYYARFLLDEAQQVTASTLAAGAPGNGVDITGDTQLFVGDWQAGDRIVGIGLDYTGATAMTRVFVHLDFDGAHIIPASSVGAADGTISWDVGDTSSFFTSDGNGRFRLYQHAVFNGPSSDGGSNFDVVWGGPPPGTPGPGRSFVVLAPGSTTHAVSGQFLLDLDALVRLGVTGQGACGADTRIGFQEADLSGSAPSYTQQVFRYGACF